MPQYSGVWTLADAARLQSQQQWVTDPLFDYTTLLLQADPSITAAQNNTFLDSSSNAFSITRNGNTTQGTFTPFSQTGWSNYFGGSGNYAVGNAAVFTNTTTTFTIEGWIYPTAAALSTSNIPAVIGDMQPTNTAAYWSFGTLASGAVTFYWYDGAGKNATTAGTVSLNTWTHIAISVNSNAITIYINGVQQSLTGTTTLTNRSGSTGTVAFAQFSSGTGSVYTGYISNFSVLSGAAKYSGSFTPSTTPLSANTTNQTLLFAAGNRFADFNTAATAKTFTITGTPSVQAFSPFAPQYQYDPTVTGGSGYFDGGGDYLDLASNAAFGFGTGDFTIEGWFYATAPTSGNKVFVDFRSGQTLVFGFGNGVTPYYYDGSDKYSTTSMSANTWNHVAWIRRSGSMYMYLNGVSVYTPVASSVGSSASNVRIGADNSGSFSQPMYCTSLRIIKGQALTTGNFTPPTAPVSTTAVGWAGANAASSITGTVSLLLNFTNAGIYDGTLKNNLETVGNAQVSTAVVKYGSGSMYFDGNGDWLPIPYGPNLALKNTYTIEAWIYPLDTNAGYRTMFMIEAAAGASFGAFSLYQNGTTLAFEIRPTTGGAVTSISGTALVANTWQHVAISVSGTSGKLFLNGSQIGTTTTLPDFLFTVSSVTVGGHPNVSTEGFYGYIDDFRITRGVARYTANFIPPSVALPRQ